MKPILVGKGKFNDIKLFIVAVFFVVAGCAQRPVVDYNPGRDFHTLHRYAWSEKSVVLDQEKLVKNALTDKRVQQSVDEVLSAQLFQKTDEAKADFLVTYHLIIKDKMNANSVGFGFGFGHPGFMLGSDVVVSQHQETELFIDILDPHTFELIWRGSVKYPTQENLSPELRTEEIRKKVGIILAAFPPR